MKFQFHLKNGETHEFSVPDDVEIRKAIMLVFKDEKKNEVTRLIVIPNDVESVEVITNG